MAHGQPDRPIPKVGDKVKTTAERFYVPRDDLERCHFAMLDLGDPSDTYVHCGRYVTLGEAELLASFGELMTAGLSEQCTRASLDLLRRDTGRIEVLLRVFPFLRRALRHICHLSDSAV